jgi:hypothetical protein
LRRAFSFFKHDVAFEAMQSRVVWRGIAPLQNFLYKQKSFLRDFFLKIETNRFNLLLLHGHQTMENCESERGIRQKKEIHIHKEIDRQTDDRERQAF